MEEASTHVYNVEECSIEDSTEGNVARKGLTSRYKTYITTYYGYSTRISPSEYYTETRYYRAMHRSVTVYYVVSPTDNPSSPRSPGDNKRDGSLR